VRPGGVRSTWFVGNGRGNCIRNCLPDIESIESVLMVLKAWSSPSLSFDIKNHTITWPDSAIGLAGGTVHPNTQHCGGTLVAEDKAVEKMRTCQQVYPERR